MKCLLSAVRVQKPLKLNHVYAYWKSTFSTDIGINPDGGNHIVCSNTLMIRSSVIKLKQMTKEYNNNNEDDSTEAIRNKSKKTLQNKEILKVLEALKSLGFRSSDYYES